MECGSHVLDLPGLCDFSGTRSNLTLNLVRRPPISSPATTRDMIICPRSKQSCQPILSLTCRSSMNQWTTTRTATLVKLWLDCSRRLVQQGLHTQGCPVSSESHWLERESFLTSSSSCSGATRMTKSRVLLRHCQPSTRAIPQHSQIV
jgi:hypothetical protein